MTEKIKGKDYLIFISGLGLLSVAIFAMPFSKGVRKEIGRRDKWTCVDCGKQFKDGWMVQAAHKSDRHHKGHPMYNDPDSGDIRCIDCHQRQHEEGTSLGKRGDNYAIGKLKQTDRRTFAWRRKRK